MVETIKIKRSILKIFNLHCICMGTVATCTRQTLIKAKFKAMILRQVLLLGVSQRLRSRFDHGTYRLSQAL